MINGLGTATPAVATVYPLPSTALWSLLAVAASRLGAVAVARRAAGTVYRRFVETTRDRETWAAHPMAGPSEHCSTYHHLQANNDQTNVHLRKYSHFSSSYYVTSHYKWGHIMYLTAYHGGTATAP